MAKKLASMASLSAGPVTIAQAIRLARLPVDDGELPWLRSADIVDVCDRGGFVVASKIDDETVIGYAVCEHVAVMSSRRVRLAILDVYVDCDYRGMGVATEMISGIAYAALSMAPELRCVIVDADDVTSGNPIARILGRCGFAATETRVGWSFSRAFSRGHH